MKNEIARDQYIRNNEITNVKNVQLQARQAEVTKVLGQAMMPQTEQDPDPVKKKRDETKTKTFHFALVSWFFFLNSANPHTDMEPDSPSLGPWDRRYLPKLSVSRKLCGAHTGKKLNIGTAPTRILSHN